MSDTKHVRTIRLCLKGGERRFYLIVRAVVAVFDP